MGDPSKAADSLRGVIRALSRSFLVRVVAPWRACCTDVKDSCMPKIVDRHSCAGWWLGSLSMQTMGCTLGGTVLKSSSLLIVSYQKHIACQQVTQFLHGSITAIVQQINHSIARFPGQSL